MKKTAKKAILNQLNMHIISLKSASDRSRSDYMIRCRLRKWAFDGSYLLPGQGLSEVAGSFGITPDELAGYFLRNMDRSFASWRRRLRITKAKELLITQPELPIQKIGALVGYPDHSNFRRRFLKEEGCTPAQFRQENIRIPD